MQADPLSKGPVTVVLNEEEKERRGKTMHQTDMNNEALQPGSTTTPFSTFLWAAVSGDLATAEAQFTDDIEWDLMPYDHILRGKEEIIPWLKAGAACQKEPIFISNLATKEWGVSELWNIGTLTEDAVESGKQLGWPFPGDPNSLVGRRFKVAQCFVYYINAEGKIYLMREYLDAGSVWARVSGQVNR